MSNEINSFYEFGDFRLDAKARILYRFEETVALKPKAVELLIALVERAGTVVSKDDLLKSVWRDTFVEENNLSVNIYELRKAFAKFDAENKFIQTVPRRGFRFVAEVRQTQNLNFKTSNFNGNENSTDFPADQIAGREIFDGAKNEEFREKENFGRNETARIERKRKFPLKFVALAFALLILTGGILYLNRESQAQKESNRESQKIIAQNQKKRPTENIEAFQLYERGRQLWQTREDEKMKQGEEYFRRAVALDPNFALPYVGLADTLSMMRDDENEQREAEINVRKALELDANSAEAHASLAFIEAMNKWHWQTAETEFKRALELDANCAKAHHWYATLLMIERRFDEAENELRRAIEIEPMSPNYNSDLCELYAYAKSFEETVAQCRRAQDIAPLYPNSGNLRIAYFVRKLREPDFKFGNADERELFGDLEHSVVRKNGIKKFVESEIRRTEQNPRSEKTLDWYALSGQYAMLGEREKALTDLEKVYAAHGFLLPFANVNPQFNSLRGDARFQDLMRRVGLND